MYIRSLKGAVKLTALLHEPRVLDLVSIDTGGNSVAFSQPEESKWPVHQMVNQMVLSCTLPNSVPTSHERTEHTLS